ncbi:hypothetical protein [Acuticoccus sediminis]|uniref:hypothetical protein n=1 Tax=Acuticoccus sediminis TaxID=2184697 RepID=UPI001CFDE851|nr:hypothetical protein [Acuticoccus sediminis]
MTASLPLVHVGMAKAASTFLQQVVLPRLPSHFYIGKHHNTPEMARALMGLTRLLSLDWKPEAAKAVIDEAVAARSAGRPVLYSEEDCSVFKFLDPAVISARLVEVLGPHDVLMVIRAPGTWVQSQYQFRLSTYHPDTLFGSVEWFDRHRQVVGIGSDLSEIRFAALAEVYRRICGGRVHIIPYELLVRDKGAFTARLADALNVEPASLEPLMNQPRDRRRDKTRITAADAGFIRLARYVVMQDPDTFWRLAEERLEACPGARELDDYAALRALTEAGTLNFSLWRPHLSRLRLRILSHLQEGEAANDPLAPEQTEYLTRVGRNQKRQLKAQFGIDLDALVPGTY